MINEEKITSYESPILSVIEIQVEQGFAVTNTENPIPGWDI